MGLFQFELKIQISSQHKPIQIKFLAKMVKKSGQSGTYAYCTVGPMLTALLTCTLILWTCTEKVRSDFSNIMTGKVGKKLCFVLTQMFFGSHRNGLDWHDIVKLHVTIMNWMPPSGLSLWASYSCNYEFYAHLMQAFSWSFFAPSIFALFGFVTAHVPTAREVLLLQQSTRDHLVLFWLKVPVAHRLMSRKILSLSSSKDSNLLIFPAKGLFCMRSCTSNLNIKRKQSSSVSHC